MITVLAIIILALAGGIFFTLNEPTPDQHILPENPAVTREPAVVTPSPIPVLPHVTGVWLRVSYNGSFTGDYGNPGNLQHVGGSGEKYYQLPDSTALVEASFSKQDYGGQNLTIEVYRNGTVITKRAVRAPMGSISFIIDPATGEFPGGIPTPTSATGLVPGETYRF